ncbi:AraC family transcriptional regulator [Spongiimicrobium sp. 2-473A-2-J]|uniref:AraC family transcriptional regulator n=1 Tax=Eudoraea algarum TaxID=3417568 RepID=UPI003D36887E
MRKFIFEKRKYGFELLMDLHRFEGNPNVFFDPAPHTTDFFEILIFEKANGKIELNGQLLDIVENSFFFISPFQKKSCKIDLSGIRGFHLVFQNDFLSDFFDDKLFTYRLQYFYNSQHPQYVQLENEDYRVIRFALDEIITEIKNFQNDSLHILRPLLYFSLSKLNRLFSKRYNISPDTQSNSTIYKFKELLELNICTIHSVEQYCSFLNVSRHQLNAMAKEHSGCTSKEMISNRLLQEIKMELRYSDKTISEIGYALNFSESNNLTRFFKNLEGISPSSYRDNYQNDSD